MNIKVRLKKREIKDYYINGRERLTDNYGGEMGYEYYDNGENEHDVMNGNERGDNDGEEEEEIEDKEYDEDDDDGEEKEDDEFYEARGGNEDDEDDFLEEDDDYDEDNNSDSVSEKEKNLNNQVPCNTEKSFTEDDYGDEDNLSYESENDEYDFNERGKTGEEDLIKRISRLRRENINGGLPNEDVDNIYYANDYEESTKKLLNYYDRKGSGKRNCKTPLGQTSLHSIISTTPFNRPNKSKYMPSFAARQHGTNILNLTPVLKPKFNRKTNGKSLQSNQKIKAKKPLSSSIEKDKKAMFILERNVNFLEIHKPLFKRSGKMQNTQETNQELSESTDETLIDNGFHQLKKLTKNNKRNVSNGRMQTMLRFNRARANKKEKYEIIALRDDSKKIDDLLIKGSNHTNRKNLIS